MKKLITLTILLLMINLVNANAYNEIENKAFELKKNNTLDTIYSIDNYVEERTTYQYNKYPVNFFDFWRTGVGDCTDKAKLKRYMLKKLDISTRAVYGIAYINGSWHRDDWYEFKINNSWYEIESELYEIKKYGNGRW